MATAKEGPTSLSSHSRKDPDTPPRHRGPIGPATAERGGGKVNKNKGADYRANGIGSDIIDNRDDYQIMQRKPYHKTKRISIQCLNCGSDYMRDAVNGNCQWCQQYVEYVLRERPRLIVVQKERGGHQR